VFLQLEQGGKGNSKYDDDHEDEDDDEEDAL